MSITPTDKPPDPDDENQSLSLGASSFRDRFQRVIESFVERARAMGLAPISPHEPAESQQSKPEGESSPRLPAADQYPRLEGFPDRDHPLTYPGRDVAGINTPDVVSVETDEGLRLSVPENPEANMTSDVWTTVEP